MDRQDIDIQSHQNTLLLSQQSPILQSFSEHNPSFFISPNQPQHHRKCIHSTFKTASPTTLQKLKWKLILLSIHSKLSFTTTTSYIDNQIEQVCTFIGIKPSTTIPTAKGPYKLYVALLDTIASIMASIYSTFPNFFIKRLQTITSFLSSQPLWDYYRYSLYHCPLILFSSMFANYLLPLLLENLPWYLSPRVLSRNVRDQRALIQQKMISPAINMSFPQKSTFQKSSLTFPPSLPSQSTTPFSNLLSTPTSTEPNMLLYTFSTLWNSLIANSLSNLRIFIDYQSRNVVKHLVLHNLLQKYDLPNNGNGGQYAAMQDTISISDFYMATTYANIYIPNIIRTSFTIWKNCTDLYAHHIDSLHPSLFLKPIALAILTELISLIRSTINPPRLISSTVNSESFFQTISSSVQDIKGYNLQSKQDAILTRIAAQERLMPLGPFNVIDKVLNTAQVSGLLDDLCENAITQFAFQQLIGSNLSQSTPPLPLVNSTPTLLSPMVVPVTTNHENSQTITRSVLSPPSSLAIPTTSTDPTQHTILSSEQQSLYFPTLIQKTEGPSQQPNQRGTLDSYIIVSREIRYISNMIKRVYNDSLAVIGFMMEVRSKPLNEPNFEWKETFSVASSSPTSLPISELNYPPNAQSSQDVTGSPTTSQSNIFPTQFNHQHPFYTSFQNLTIKKIIYTYPDPKPLSIRVPMNPADLIYSNVSNFLLSLFRIKSSSLSNIFQDESSLNNTHSHNNAIKHPLKNPTLQISPSNLQSLTFERGKLYVCCGVNTSGKSTLAQVLSRFLIDPFQVLTAQNTTQNKTSIDNSIEDGHFFHFSNTIDISLNLTIFPTAHTPSTLQSMPNQLNSQPLPPTPSFNIISSHYTIPLQHYRKHISYLRQKPFIFNATLIDNITGHNHTYQSAPDPSSSASSSSSAQSPITALQMSNLLPLSSFSLPIHSIDSIPHFLSQKLTSCVCECHCGNAHCSQQAKSCSLSLKWICWSIFLSGLYNTQGEIDNEALQQQQQQEQQDKNIESANNPHKSLFNSNFQSANRPWLQQQNTNHSFMERVLAHVFGASALNYIPFTNKLSLDQNKEATILQPSPLDHQDDCNCDCSCYDCSFSSLQSSSLHPHQQYYKQCSHPSPSSISSPPHTSDLQGKELWDSIKNIRPIPQELFMSLNCDELLERISQTHPILNFPFHHSTVHFTSVDSVPYISQPDSTTSNPENGEQSDNLTPESESLLLPLPPTLQTLSQPLLPPSGLLEMFITNNGGNISGGFAQSVALARMFVRVHAQYIILDESLSMMDFSKFSVVFPRIVAFSKAINATIIVISHHLRHLVKLADGAVVFMDRGDIVAFDQDENIDNSVYRTLVDL